MMCTLFMLFGALWVWWSWNVLAGSLSCYMTILAWPSTLGNDRVAGLIHSTSSTVLHSHSLSIVMLFVQYKHFGWLYVITPCRTGAWTSTLTHTHTHTEERRDTNLHTLTSGILFHAEKCLLSNRGNERSQAHARCQDPLQINTQIKYFLVS